MNKSKRKVSDFKVSPIKIMRELGDMIEEYKHYDDSDFFYDRTYFMKMNLDNDMDTYHSTDKDDKETIIDYDLNTINNLSNKYSDLGGLFTLPKMEEFLTFQKMKYQSLKYTMYFIKPSSTPLKEI